MYIYITQQCNDNAKKYGVEPEITKLRNDSNARDRFEPIYPYWKRGILGNLRLLAKIEKVDNDEVLCLLNILRRGDKEYNEFKDKEKREEFGQNYLEPLLNLDELRQWLDEQKESGSQQQNQREHLPDELLDWLELPSWRKDSNDLVIYESEQWVKKCGQQKIKERRETYLKIILTVSENNGEGESTNLPDVKLSSNPEGLSVLFSRLETIPTEDIPSRKVLFLLAPFTEKPSPDDIEEVVKAISLFNSDEGVNNITAQLSVDELARLARRSYPAYLLLDFDSWLAIEKDEESNLALSGEEEQILQSVSTPGKSSLPMFINGRAGSGKSTMLFHLFADYCERHWKSCQERKQDFYQKPHPLFLTYSESLLKVAKDSVQSLLTSHHQFLQNRIDQEEAILDIDPFFQPFQKFLLDLLPSTEYERFQPEKYISYNQFRQLYKESKLPEVKNKSYSAGRCWHIIRTFIKGYSLDGYMNEEDYQEVPRKERTVSEETFQKIYEKIWERWYKGLTEKEHYWDDQDLIRRVLELKCYRPEYTAIFCDESQDFTRLELQLIVQLSVFSQYDFGYNHVPSLPCAFAGDPFQTLNPTGFRWDSVGALFYNEVLMRLDPANKLKLEMNFKELKVNYRSSSSIVKVTNLIQLWRCLRFKLADIKPQTPWQKKDSPSKPQKFILERNLSLEELKNHIEKKPIFIVPCETGGEIDYIKNDEVLQKLFPQVNEGKTPENVYSAIKAKGLEFPLVILYKFGHELAQEYDEKAVWNFDDNAPSDSVELEYYFNKLYVAASRAMSDLVVIDSEAGDRLLWQRASDDQIGQFLEHEQWKADERKDWTDLLGTISEGDSLLVLDQDNRESQAQRLKKQGQAEENPEFLKNAKEYYSALGNTGEADICEALALKFEKQFSEAGQLFLNRGKKKDAWECFWEGACWEKLKQWCENHPTDKPVERSLVDFMTEPSPKALDFLNKFTEFLEKRNENNSLKNYRSSKPWQEAVKEYTHQINELMRGQNPDCAQWQRFGILLEELDGVGYNGTLEVAGYCFYHAKIYKSAVRCWERCKATQKREYYLAKAEVEGFPEGLQYLQKAGQEQRIVQEWEKQGKPDRPQWLDYVVPALQNQNQYKELVAYLISQKLWLKAIEAIDKCPNPNEAISLKFNVVRAIAYSDLTPDTARSDRPRYKSFMASVRALTNWQQELSVEEFGNTLEKIGELVPILEFYEVFVEDSNSKVRNFARERWIAAKKKQVEYEESTDGNKLKQRQEELDNNARKWGIKPESVSVNPPLEYSSRRVDDSLLSEQSNKEVEGEAHWKTLGSGVEQRQIGRLQVMRIKAMKQLTISDDTSKVLQVTLDSGGCTVKGKVEYVEVSGSNRLVFKVPESGYNCEVFYSDASPRLELNIQDLSDKITITF